MVGVGSMLSGLIGLVKILWPIPTVYVVLTKFLHGSSWLDGFRPRLTTDGRFAVSIAFWCSKAASHKQQRTETFTGLRCKHEFFKPGSPQAADQQFDRFWPFCEYLKGWCAFLAQEIIKVDQILQFLHFHFVS